MCGGFSCSKNSLAFLNSLFLLVSFLLIGVASYAKAAAVIKSYEIAGGIIASGLFLFLIAFLGLIAGAKHHQVLLFFYIVVLFLLFIIQFSVSIACLAVSEGQVKDSLSTFWHNFENNQTSPDASEQSNLLVDAQNNFHCCEWDMKNNASLMHCEEQGYCEKLPSDNVATKNTCKLCSDVIPQTVSGMLEATGGIGLFFSFTEMLGVWLAVRFRNQKDPGANPSQFL